MRILPLVALTLCLSGCSYGFAIDIRIADGKVFFDAHRKGLFAPKPCVAEFRVRVDREITWAFESPKAGLTNACFANFPITYGELPAGAIETKAPGTLQHGKQYTVEAYGPGMKSEGEFKLRRVLILEQTEETND